jgi:hypothetical protein
MPIWKSDRKGNKHTLNLPTLWNLDQVSSGQYQRLRALLRRQGLH